MKILLATDGSEYSKAAAEFLTSLDLSSDDEIIIFHAISPIPCIYGRESYIETVGAIKKEIAPRILDSALKVLNGLKARIDTLVLDGSPDSGIVDASVDSDADLIVVGARGTKGTESPLIGSVARAVVTESAKPVLVIKSPAWERRERIKILFATDGSVNSAATAKMLSGIPFKDNAEVTVMNVISWEWLDIPKEYVPELNERLNEIIEETGSARLSESRKIVDQAKEYLSRKFINIIGLSKVGDPSTEIIKASAALDSDLVVVGCRGLRGIRRMMGSVSRNIVTESKCSVLIGKTCGE